MSTSSVLLFHSSCLVGEQSFCPWVDHAYEKHLSSEAFAPWLSVWLLVGEQEPSCRRRPGNSLLASNLSSLSQAFGEKGVREHSSSTLLFFLKPGQEDKVTQPPVQKHHGEGLDSNRTGLLEVSESQLQVPETKSPNIFIHFLSPPSILLWAASRPVCFPRSILAFPLQETAGFDQPAHDPCFFQVKSFDPPKK